MITNTHEFDMPEPTKLMVAGDWHNNAKWAIQELKRARLNGCDAVLQLGDFGYWPRLYPGYYKALVQYLRGPCKGLIRLYWLDGNHEDFEVLSQAEGIGNEVIQHLPRGHRWEWWGKTWMSVGGGVSVDKKWRMLGKDWFPEETLTPWQFEYCLRDGQVDIVVAHDAPTGVDIPGIHAREKLGLEPSFFPVEQIMESWEHRDIMAEIVKDKDPEWWFHGHYHRRYNARHAGGMNVVGLDCDASEIELNAVILTREHLEAPLEAS